MNKIIKVSPIILFGLLLIGCPIPTTPPSDTSLSDSASDTSTTGPIAEKYFWGYWTRMDTGETYLISDKQLKIGEATPVSISSVSATELGFGSVIIRKQSDNVANLGSNALLFRNGGYNRSFTAKLAGFTSSSRSIGIGNQPIAGRIGTRTNTENSSDTQSVTSEADGKLNFTGAVSNSWQEISIDTTGTNVQPINVTVQPSFNGEFIGTIPFVENGHSFKVLGAILNSENGYQYGNGYNSYQLAIEIKNIGNADCSTSLYEITSQDPNLNFLSGSFNIPYKGNVTASLSTGNMSSIEPGKSKTLYFLLQYGKLDSEYNDVTLKINITDSGTNPRTWEDYVVIRFYKRPVSLNITSLNLDQVLSAKLKGFLIHPDGQSLWFTVDNKNTESILLPWISKQYSLVFSGAGADNEMKYSFAVDTTPANVDNTFSIAEINAYENNDSESNQKLINDPSTPIKSYLKKGDIDYFKIDVSKVSGDFIPIVIDEYSLANHWIQNSVSRDMYLDLRIKSMFGIMKNLTATFSSSNKNITFKNPIHKYSSLYPGTYITCSEYSSYNQTKPSDAQLNARSSDVAFSIPTSTPVGTKIPINVVFKDDTGYEWSSSFTITIP